MDAEVGTVPGKWSRARQYLDIVITKLDRLAVLSSRLLTLPSADSSPILHRCRVNVGDVVTDIGRRWPTTVSRNWRPEPPPTTTTIEADRDRLEAALDALVENAIEFTDENDTITIRGERADDMVTLAVADTGSGIAPDMRLRIFGPFARADFGHDRRNGGTGLGLAIVRAIVEAHGGTVDVNSAIGLARRLRSGLPVAGDSVAEP